MNNFPSTSAGSRGKKVEHRKDTPMPLRVKCTSAKEAGTPKVNLFGIQDEEKVKAPELFRHYRGHKNEIMSIDFHPNLSRVASGGKDGYVMSWNYEDEKARTLRFEGHEKGVTGVAFNRDGDLLLSSSEDSMIRIWVPTMRGDGHSFKAHHSAITSLACSPVDSTQFVTASTDKSIKFWSVGHKLVKPSAQCVPTLKIKSHQFLGSHAQNSWIHSVRYQPESNGNVVCTAADNSTLSVIDNRGANLVSSIKSSTLEDLRYAEFNPGSNIYLGACSGDQLHIYDIRTQKLVQIYMELHSGRISQFAFHAAGDFAFTAGDDRRIKIIDLVEGRPIFTLVGPLEGLSCISASKDGTLFATGGADKNLLVWKPFLMPYTKETMRKIEESNDLIPEEGPTIGTTAEFYKEVLIRKTEQ